MLIDHNWELKQNYLLNIPAYELGYTLAVSCRDGGSMRFEDGAPNRAVARFLQLLSEQERRLFVCKQVHGDKIIDVSSALSDYFPEEADGLFAHSSDAVLGVFTADCLSIALIDPISGLYSLVHSGWRGSAAGIAQSALQKLKAAGAKIEDINIFFGPAIQSCCYQVGPEFRGHFEESSLAERSGSLYFDNQGYVSSQLIACGVQPDNVYKSRLCTACRNDLFFSYRLEKEAAGRQITVLSR